MMDVSRETIDRLRAFEALLVKWNSKINLVSAGDDLWERHILDSLQLMDFLPRSGKKLLDFGSGGGLPAIVIAAAASEAFPNLPIVMIESDHRKSAFLRTCIRELGLNATVRTNRIEKDQPQTADIITARATASLENLLRWSALHGTPNMTCLFLKGQKSASEINEAREKWEFDVEINPSQTHDTGRILRITNVKEK